MTRDPMVSFVGSILRWEGHYFRLIGEAYTYGPMDGEVRDMVETGDFGS